MRFRGCVISRLLISPLPGTDAGSPFLHRGSKRRRSVGSRSTTTNPVAGRHAWRWSGCASFFSPLPLACTNSSSISPPHSCSGALTPKTGQTVLGEICGQTSTFTGSYLKGETAVWVQTNFKAEALMDMEQKDLWFKISKVLVSADGKEGPGKLVLRMDKE
jgi:hypothetical protein